MFKEQDNPDVFISDTQIEARYVGHAYNSPTYLVDATVTAGCKKCGWSNIVKAGGPGNGMQDIATTIPQIVDVVEDWSKNFKKHKC